MNIDKSVLPEDFDGVFKFTNWSDQEFVGMWNNIAYTFPPLLTSPMIISGSTPEEVQSIRKKFAKELAEREFYKTPQLKSLEAQNPNQTIGSLHAAVTYNPRDLEPGIQRCLEPLAIGKVTAKVLPKADETTMLRTDDEGKPVTRVLKGKESLVGEGSPIE